MDKNAFLIIKILFLLSLVFSSIDVTSAGVVYNSYYGISIDNTGNIHNMSTLYSALVDKYGEEYVKENMLNEISPKIWWCGNKLSVPNPGNFWINDTDTEELRICRNQQGWSFNGYITPSNVKLVSWDKETNKPYGFEGGGISVMYNEAHDVEFHNFNVVYFGYNYGDSIKNLSYSNITLDHTRIGLSFQRAENITVDNITIKNGDPMFGDGLDHCYMNNSTLSHIQVINVSDYQNPATGAYGLTLIGNNNIVHDYYINGTAWSGTNLHGSNLTVYNFTVVNSGHNGFESQVHDSYFRNITVKDSDAHNFFQVSHDDEPASNNIYENLYGARPGSYNFILTDNSLNTIIRNSTFSGTGIDICDSKNITIINCTQSDAYGTGASGLYLTKYSCDLNENHKVIDSSFSNNTAGYRDIWLNYGENTKIINTDYSSLSISNNMCFTKYYYIDILVKNKSGSLIENSNILLLNENDSQIESVNGYGEYMNAFPTNGGRLYLPNNDRQNSPSIANCNMTKSSESLKQLHTATITTPDDRTISLSGITPDSSWYREDPNIPTYTITAIIPDSSSEGPHITGFAPSEENPFKADEEKIFRVWTDEPLTSMEWYVDGSPVSGGALSYTLTVTEGDHLIEFKGSNVNGDVNQSWNIGESSGAQPSPAIEFFPAGTELTRNIGEPVTFSVNSDQPMTTNWLINGELVRNDEVSMTQNWDTPGTYEVMVTGTSGEEAITHTWMVDVIDSEKSQDASNVTVSPDHQIVAPNQPFNIDVSINPDTAITGAQFELLFDSQMLRADSVTEGNLLNQDGAVTLFNSGTINNNEGTVTDIYGLILASDNPAIASNVASPGVMATISMTAGNRTGIAELRLSNVRVSDSNITYVPVSIRNASVLVDTAPVLHSIGSKFVSESNTLSFTVDASDADGNSLTYSAAGLPEGANFDTATGEFSWTPATGQAGTYTVTFEVSDGYLTNPEPEDVTITVDTPNRAPVIDLFEPEDGSSFNESEEIDISVSAFDLDGQFLNYIIKINGIKCSTDTSYVWKTNYSSSGEHTVEVTVSDGIDQVTEQHTIYVIDYYPPWDVVKDEDREVNILDMATVGQAIGTVVSKPYPRYDVNQDGRVNIQDLSIVGYHFGEKINIE